MNKLGYIILTLALAMGIGFMFIGGSEDNTVRTSTQSAQNVEIKDGVQYVTINARGGYSPRVSNAQSDIPTKLVVKTNGTYDCSTALVIRSINYQKILPQTGEEIIDLGIYKSGQSLQGLCSMGMYSFQVQFS